MISVNTFLALCLFYNFFVTHGRLVKCFAIASLMVLSSASVAFAQCNDKGWCKIGCGEQSGACYSVKLLNSNYPIRKVKFKSSQIKEKSTLEFDCQSMSRFRFVNEDGSSTPWEEAIPGNILEATILKSCSSM